MARRNATSGRSLAAAAVLALFACGGGSPGEPGAPGGGGGVASSCPCSGGLVCAQEACWEPCGAGGSCKPGYVCLKGQACLMLEAYPLPDGEVVRKGLSGSFSAFQVSGDWMFLVGRPERDRGPLGLYAAKLDGGSGLELRATLAEPAGSGEPSSVENLVAYGGKIYYADRSGRAFVSPVEPWAPKPIETGLFTYMVPSVARDTIVFLQAETSFTVRGLSTATGEPIGPEHALSNVTMLLAPEARSALVMWNVDPVRGPKWELSRVDLATGALVSLGIPGDLSGAGYPLKDSVFGSAWAFGDSFVRINSTQGTLTLLDLAKPGGQERGIGTALHHVAVAADGMYAVAPSSRGQDLVRVGVPSGASASLGWLRSTLQSFPHGPHLAVDGPWVYAVDLDGLADPFHGVYGQGWVYRFRR